MAINIDSTFIIAVVHKKMMHIGFVEDKNNRLAFSKVNIVEYNDTATLFDIKNRIKNYIGSHINHLGSCKIKIRVHEFISSARVTVYVEILSKNNLKDENLKLIPLSKVHKYKCSTDVEKFLYHYYEAKKQIDRKSLATLFDEDQ